MSDSLNESHIFINTTTIKKSSNNDYNNQLNDNNLQNNSTINLIGYGIGASVIYYCLLTMYKEDAYAAKGIIGNVIMLGAPVKIKLTHWKNIRSIVSGRFINGYSTNDWILAIKYRMKSYELLIAGLQPIYLDSKRKSNVKMSSVSSLNNLNELNELKTNELSNKLDNLLLTVREIENIDLSLIIKSQADYPKQLERIFTLIRLEN